MIIIRDKSYSYQPILGTTYDSAQIRQNIDDGVVKVADHLDKLVDYADCENPIINKASKKWRGRITGYTDPIKRLLRRKKVKK